MIEMRFIPMKPVPVSLVRKFNLVQKQAFWEGSARKSHGQGSLRIGYPLSDILLFRGPVAGCVKDEDNNSYYYHYQEDGNPDSKLKNAFDQITTGEDHYKEEEGEKIDKFACHDDRLNAGLAFSSLLPNLFKSDRVHFTNHFCHPLLQIWLLQSRVVKDFATEVLTVCCYVSPKGYQRQVKAFGVDG